MVFQILITQVPVVHFLINNRLMDVERDTEGMEKQQVNEKEQIHALPGGTTYSPELSKCSIFC